MPIVTASAGSFSRAISTPFSSPASTLTTSSARRRRSQIFQPPMNSQPISDADRPRVEAIERSMLPVMMMNTIGSTMMPISMKSEVVRSRLLPFKKKGESRAVDQRHHHDQRDQQPFPAQEYAHGACVIYSVSITLASRDLGLISGAHRSQVTGRRWLHLCDVRHATTRTVTLKCAA